MSMKRRNKREAELADWRSETWIATPASAPRTLVLSSADRARIQAEHDAAVAYKRAQGGDVGGAGDGGVVSTGAWSASRAIPVDTHTISIRTAVRCRARGLD